MSVQDIQTIIRAFTDAAVRAKKSGFDGVQIHVAHGFLLNQFLTPHYNRRSDEYGGSIENRSRIVIETYKSIRNAVGNDFAIMAKINCDDFMENGLTLADSSFVCELLAENDIDAIEVSGGSNSSRPNENPARVGITSNEEESYFKDYATQITQQIDVPVFLVGGNRSLETMSDLLNSTQIAYFSMARPLLCEPGLITRWESGNTQKAKCVSCNKCYSSEGYRHCILSN